MRGHVFSTNYVIRDVVLPGRHGLAGFADLLRRADHVRRQLCGARRHGMAGAPLAGIGQPAAEWRAPSPCLRTAPTAARVGAGVQRPLPMCRRSAATSPPWRGCPSATATRWSEPAACSTRRRELSSRAPGDAGNSAYFVLSGADRRRLDQQRRGTSIGVGSGASDVFGEIAALTGRPRRRTSWPRRRTSLLEVPADTLRTLMATPDFRLPGPWQDAGAALTQREHPRPAAIRRHRPDRAAAAARGVGSTGNTDGRRRTAGRDLRLTERRVRHRYNADPICLPPFASTTR